MLRLQGQRPEHRKTQKYRKDWKSNSTRFNCWKCVKSALYFVPSQRGAMKEFQKPFTVEDGDNDSFFYKNPLVALVRLKSWSLLRNPSSPSSVDWDALSSRVSGKQWWDFGSERITSKLNHLRKNTFLRWHRNLAFLISDWPEEIRSDIH